MKRISVLLLLLLFVFGCTPKTLIYPNHGLVPAIVLVEINSNASSLLYDKTKAKYDDFFYRNYYILPEESVYYVIPASVSTPGAKTYNEELSKMVESYIVINGFGKTSRNVIDADYVVMPVVQESFDKTFGENSSKVDIMIMELDETLVFYSSVKVRSKSDKNFFYFETKPAEPVNYLTLKGFNKIFEEGLPLAFYDEG